ncbi:protein of unknown function [Georgfuchsia toluolica]|uniref:Uncharacterized protein n=1 Tax=Georgfuchsia toluolica TaxID=424218 RepID=A0A916J7B8_9PROT|nr:protein of unknown function [Georgfuchsia toluolica]
MITDKSDEKSTDLDFTSDGYPVDFDSYLFCPTHYFTPGFALEIAVLVTSSPNLRMRKRL